MKRYTILSLFFLTFILPIFAAVGETFTNSDAKYANLVFTVLDEDAKTVSVKAEDISYYRADSILNIPASVTNSGDTYTVTTIATNGFNAIKIKQIILPPTIKIIGEAALRNITTPFTIELNEGLEEIGNRAFCRSTGMIGTLTLPSTLQTIYSSAAFLSLSISQIIINTPVPPTFTKNEDTAYPIPNVPIVIPCNTYDAYANTWSAYTSQFIDPCIFSDGTYTYQVLSEDDSKVAVKALVDNSIQHVTFSTEVTNPDNDQTYLVVKIADNCFNNNATITSVTLPPSLISIGASAFYKCKNLQTISLNEGLEFIGEKAFVGLSDIQGTTIIPSTVDTIGDYAFADWVTPIQFLSEVPAALGGTQVFRDALKQNSSIIIPCGTYEAYNKVKNWNLWLSRIVDPCLFSFSDGTYTYQVLPEDDSKVAVKALVDNSIQHVTFSTEVTNPDNDQTYLVAKIIDNCFNNNATITSVTLPPSLISIGAFAFYNCINLQTISLNEGLEFIGEKAFAHDSLVTGTLTIPSSVTSIGTSAFYNFSKIEKIDVLPQMPPAIGTSIFTALPNNATIIIPCGSLNLYQNANNWKNLSSKFISACKPLTLKKGEALTQDTIVSSIAYSRTFDMDVWQTLYLPFEVDSVLVEEIWEGKPYYYDINKPYDSQKGGYFYLNNYKEASAEDETITFTPATTLEGNTPYLIQFPQISSDGYFAGKNIIFKSKTGEHILKKSDYTQPKASNLFQISGNSSVYNQDVSKMYIFAATAVKDDQGNPVKTSDGRDSIKYEFNQQTSTTLKPFDFGLLPYEVKPSSGASLLPTRMSLRISRGSGNTGGGNITTSIADSEAAYAITYRVNANNLLLHQNGHPCQLYSISGTLLYTSAEGTEEVTIPLEKGIYILYCEGQSQKIVL